MKRKKTMRQKCLNINYIILYYIKYMYSVISFGHRCSSATIIQNLNLKTESYPFDWLVSKITNELYVEDFMIAHLNEYSSKKDAQLACLNKLIEIVGQQKQIK